MQYLHAGREQMSILFKKKVTAVKHLPHPISRQLLVRVQPLEQYVVLCQWGMQTNVWFYQQS